MKVQRLRVTFSRGEEMKYITHLDMMRFWERALRRAGVPLFYSEGFSPHAQIALAAPLAVGVTSDAELMDVFLEQAVTPRAFIEQVTTELPPAVRITAAREVGMALPSMQADVRAAEYEIEAEVPTGLYVSRAVSSLLEAESFPWEHMREDELRSYDLRPLVHEVEVLSREGNSARLRMLLRNDSSGSGRPEQVTRALGLAPPSRIHRTRLVLADTSPARAAARRQGRYAG